MGYVPRYNDGRGQHREGAAFVRSELGEWTPTIHVGHDSKNDEFTVRLAYAQRVRGWTAFVDANDGSLIDVRQDFRT